MDSSEECVYQFSNYFDKLLWNTSQGIMLISVGDTKMNTYSPTIYILNVFIFLPIKSYVKS